MKRWWNIYWTAGIVAVLIIIIGILFSFVGPCASVGNPLQYAKFQSVLTVVSAIAIIFTLTYTTFMFRRAIAIPIIKVTFNEARVSEITVNLYRSNSTDFREQKICDLVVTNTGEAVATIFQINLEAPQEASIATPEIERRLRPYITTDRQRQKNIDIISICNNGMPFFVNSPVKVTSLVWRTEPRCSTQLPFKFEIKYKVFGNWTGRQEGILIVHVMSQS
jgi:hypothetical protein